jgi:hypothetical protein
MEQIMEIIEYARKGNIMNIKEHYYIYKFKQLNELTEEQKSIKENNNQNSMFDIMIRCVHAHKSATGNKGINTPHTTRIMTLSMNYKPCNSSP